MHAYQKNEKNVFGIAETNYSKPKEKVANICERCFVFCR